jgi:hypothetical protein
MDIEVRLHSPPASTAREDLLKLTAAIKALPRLAVDLGVFWKALKESTNKLD